MPFSIFMAFLLLKVACSETVPGNFSFYGLLKLEGVLEVDSNGATVVTNSTAQDAGYAYYSSPLQFKNSSAGDAFSFSTTFAFAVPSTDLADGSGFYFVISPSKGAFGISPNNSGLSLNNSDGNSPNHTIVVELDQIFTNNQYGGKNLMFHAGDPIQSRVEYNSTNNKATVTLSPVGKPRPSVLLLTLTQDISSDLYEYMYVGFSSLSETSSASHYILAWNFKMNGEAEDIEASRLPKLPESPEGKGGYGKIKKILAVVLSLAAATFVLVLVFGAILLSRKRRSREVLEDWEVQYGPHKFTYKELFAATKGFKDREILGKGGFGRVYRGLLLASNMQIAVKRVAHDSNQGMREFVAEIATIGRLRHPNLARLLGYCRHKQELFLVYDYMPNGSLDKYLYGQPKSTLDWGMRYKILKDVAAALFYLHQQWTQVVIHRDIKASNVLIDGDMNGRLGDFGLAKLVEHGTDPQTSVLAGTLGYIAPELARTGKANTSTDLFAFGVFMLEVVCGRRPLDPRAPEDQTLLAEWVLNCWDRGDLLETVDGRLQNDYAAEEAEVALKLGLYCSHVVAAARPSMSSVVQYLTGVSKLPDNLRDIIEARDFPGSTSATSSDVPQNISFSSLTISASLVTEGR
ncbi:L-type lectin-domain containing receptor kinase V.9-like [Rhodamnia argentea]|uniref:L-type lectin-domain containing receptor kinase V.9-like n=1 Tax=Rhodamnia argentea TaxID=178133 RepID=A0A8B8NU88_9MYRT|nr:L-type lectin-domain containing receptor kinase V.9-like [Rhodamnia argentea]